MAADPFVPLKNFNQRRRDFDVHFLTDILVRYGIVNTVRYDMVVRLNGCRFPMGDFVPCLGKLGEQVFLLGKKGGSASQFLLELVCVVFVDMLP